MKTTAYFNIMRIRADRAFIKDTDTLYIELNSSAVAETRDLDDDTLLDLDAEGNMVAITMEHASRRTDLEHLTLSGLAA